ncbi:Ankyrin repeat [Wolbachia endosymbiont of Cylisticus convexus]|uniref:ankyrin repeat domain-containing protein n=1 Tax=Wolbachia endosymbiont of Cylisticus convexus TaxID=118728 RepID=UPI000DF6D102|nr:ankyrin repeat domain-containing protein [Wolbachia endosymbiont of Cylisticus convexus]RDD34026.1 Ankyrin repeat [Wolbachia endosymbiont of Cylisticus convexus]
MINSLAKGAWRALNSNNSDSLIAYGIGLGKVNGNTLRPDYATIMMNETNANTENLSRVIPDPIQNATMICLPQITNQDYEKGIKSSVPSAKYYCDNAMVISHDRKVNVMQKDKTIVYDLIGIDRGTIVGSNEWNNNFLISSGAAEITGGNSKVVNRFVVHDVNFSGKIIGKGNSTNILDLSKLAGDKVIVNVNYRFEPSASGQLKVKINDHLLIDDYIDSNIFNYHYVGRKNKVDRVLCIGYSEHFTGTDDREVIIDSGGGSSNSEKDVVEGCKKVIISPYTTVKSRKNDYTFYVKTADYKGRGLYSRIDVDGTGTVIFPKIDLLSDCDQITYSKNNNTLSLKINFGQNDQFTLDIKNYVEQSSNKPHFVLIDRNGSNIVPKIERSDSSIIKITSFELHSEHSLNNFKDVENHYKKILNNHKGYKVFGVIRDKVQDQNNSTVPHMVFGSLEDDVINFDQGTMFARGGNGSDIYVIDSNTEKGEIIIDNNSDDKKLDTMLMQEVPREFKTQEFNLYLGDNVVVKDYFRNDSYGHLMVMNSKGETFIPYVEPMLYESELYAGSSMEYGKLVPFFHATQTQDKFFLPKDFQGDHVVIDSCLEDIKKYKDKDNLLLIRESGISFVIRIEDFYNDQSKWRDVNFLLWNNGNFFPYLGLQQEVDGIMDYQENDYEKIMKEYVIDFNQSINITHNQNDTLISVGQDEERVGVVILKNVAPDWIRVSSSDTDLVFSDEVSNHVVNIKNWNNSESYRISTLEFDLGIEPIIIRRLDRFNLSEVRKIQDLIEKVSENYNNKDKYTPKIENDFKCLISIDGFESENKNPMYRCLGFSSLQDQISFTEKFCSLEQLTEFGDKLNSTQASVLSRKLQNNLSLNGYDQSVVGQCSKLILAEENNQQVIGRISSMIKNVEESTSLNQSKREKKSSDFYPIFLENIHNKLNAEESKRKNIIVDENSVRVITSGYEILDIENLPIREVVISNDINKKKSLRDTLDFRQLVRQINRDLSIEPTSRIIKDESDLLIGLFLSATGLQKNVIKVRLKDALVNNWHKKLQIIFNNAPMEIDESLGLKPSLLISDEEIVVVTPQDVEENRKLIISKEAGQYAFLYLGYDLIVTNAFNANVELCIIYFKDFYKEPKMKTLSIRFADKKILLSDEMDKIYNADDIDKLNYISSFTNLQKSPTTSICLAAQYGDLSQVKLLFDNGANIEAQDRQGWTPILLAAEAGKWSIVKFLLDNGANIDNETTYQGTPLHYAVQEGNLDIVEFLLDRGADIESQNYYNQKPLHIAVQAGRLNVVNLLLDRGANVKARDSEGWTPLHWAAQFGSLDVVVCLVERDADVNALTFDNRTPLDLAIHQNYGEIEEYLRSKSAVQSSMLIPHVTLANDRVRHRKRRHHHGDHNRHYSHLLNKHSIIDSSNQSEIVASSSTRPSSWINDLFSWVKDSIGGLFSSRAALPEETLNTTSSISQIDAPIDVNGTIMLLDLLIRKVTGQKYISTADQPISPLEAQGYALNITKEFERLLNETATKSGISVENLNFDPVAVQSAVVRQIVSEKFSEIPKTLYSFAKEACPELKQTDKFLVHLRSQLEGEKETALLQQKVEKPSKILDQQVSGKVELSKKPDTFLNGTSVVKGISSVLER